MGDTGAVEDINTLITQCSSDELEAILRTLEQGDAGGVENVLSDTDSPTNANKVIAGAVEAAASPPADAAAGTAPTSTLVTAQTAPTEAASKDEQEEPARSNSTDSYDKEAVGAIIRKSLQEGMEIQETLMALGVTQPNEDKPPSPLLPEVSDDIPASSAFNVSNMEPPGPGDDDGRRAPPSSPVMHHREVRAPKPPLALRSGASEDPSLPEASKAKEEIELPVLEPPKQQVECGSTLAGPITVSEGPTLDTLLQLMKEQHQSVLAQVQWVASMNMPSTEYLTGVLNQRDEDITGLQARLDQLRAEVQTSDDRIANQYMELNESVQSCRHWLVDLEFHKQQLDESMQLNQALEYSNKNLVAEVESASQQLKHASLDVEQGGGFSSTPIVTPRGIELGLTPRLSGIPYSNMHIGYGGMPMQGSIPWVFRKHRP